MTGVRDATSIALILAVSLCVTSVADAKTPKSKKVYTSFGYVKVSPLDVERATAEGKAVEEAARRLLLLPSLHIAIIEEGASGGRWGSVSDGYVIYPWPFSNGSRRLSARPATHVLRHEIGHDLLERYVIPNSRKDQYGTDAPDWLDEMVAVAFEGVEQQSDRRRTAKRELTRGGLLLPSKLLSMEHPEFRSYVSVNSHEVISTMAPTSSDTIRFYSTIQAFYDFLIMLRGDNEIISSLTSAYMRHKDLKAWVVSSVFSGRGEKGLEDVDAAFLDWLSTDPRYITE